MIQGFEEQTAPLTDYEKETLLPALVKVLSGRIGSDKAVTNAHLVRVFKQHGYTISDARVRKIINHIRVHRLVSRLVASSKGYYVTNSQDELESFCASLRGREEAIRAVRIAMEKQFVTTLF